MNEYQHTLYINLLRLVDHNEAFFYKDFVLDGRVYRIFNYRLASYSDFCEPNAEESRGIMFEVANDHHDADVYRLACLPPEKFYNYKENPKTMEIDFDRAVSIHDKADGSLISSYVHRGELADIRLKTKGSLTSDQVYQAEEFLFNNLRNSELVEDVIRLTEDGFTVNMEWCSPENRIVLGYQEPSLKVFSVRALENGSYIPRETLRDQFNCHTLVDNWVDEIVVDNIQDFINDVPKMKDIEGVVVTLDDDQKIKLKTEWYLARHHTKDSINTPRRLFEAILEEATDDMKAMFWNDVLAIKQIEEMEAFVEHKYNHMVAQVEEYYEQNKDLDRKSYAIKGQQELDKMHFGLAMKKFEGKDVDYKAFLKSQWKKLGLKDEKEAFDDE